MLLTDLGKTRIDVSKSDRISFSTASRGNQLKWKSGDKFVKLNYIGYEGLAEHMVSWFLQFTDIPKEDYVEYTSCYIYENGRLLGKGCYSEDFLHGRQEITIRRLLETNIVPFSIGYDELLDFLYDETGKYFKDYLDRILCLDSIIRNDDRHFGNISLIYTGEYLSAPIFDNGLSCLSDINTYPIDIRFEDNYKAVLAKPFNTDFKRQIHNVKRISVKYDEFIESMQLSSPEAKRAKATIIRGLNEMEGISWERC